MAAQAPREAIAFLQPLGDTAGMRDARAPLASLDAKLRAEEIWPVRISS